VGSNHELVVTLPTESGEVGVYLNKDIPSVPAVLTVSFVLSAVNVPPDKYLEVLNVTDSSENASLFVSVDQNVVSVTVQTQSPVLTQGVDLGPPPIEPTRFTIRATSDGISGQRGTDPAIRFLDGGVVSTTAVTVSAGLIDINAPAGGTFRLDDVLIE
jgi:hypothetical protein